MTDFWSAFYATLAVLAAMGLGALLLRRRSESASAWCGRDIEFGGGCWKGDAREIR